MSNVTLDRGVSTCRTCKWLDVAARKDGKIVPRKGDSYRCVVPIPAPPRMPASITVVNGSRSYYGGQTLNWPQACGFMRPDDGAGCAFYRSRK